MNNDIIKALTSPGVDLNELIKIQASQQTGTVPPQKNSQFGGQVQKVEKGKVYQKTRANSVKRHK